MKYPVFVAAVLGILLASCTRKAEGQSVAVVNGSEITIPELNFALGQAQLPEGADKTAARAQVLQKLIDRSLLVEQARKEGVDATPEYLNGQRQADENLLISMLAARRLKTAQVPSDREVQTFIASNPQMFANREIWDIDQITFTPPSDPKTVAAVQNTHSMDDLIAVLQKNNIRDARRKTRLDTAAITSDLFARINGLPAGEPFIVPLGNQSLANVVIARQPQPRAGDDAKPVAVEAMRKRSTMKSLEDLLKSLRNSAKIEYQPGFAPQKKS